MKNYSKEESEKPARPTLRLTATAIRTRYPKDAANTATALQAACQTAKPKTSQPHAKKREEKEKEADKATNKKKKEDRWCTLATESQPTSEA